MFPPRGPLAAASTPPTHPPRSLFAENKNLAPFLKTNKTLCLDTTEKHIAKHTDERARRFDFYECGSSASKSAADVGLSSLDADGLGEYGEDDVLDRS